MPIAAQIVHYDRIETLKLVVGWAKLSNLEYSRITKLCLDAKREWGKPRQSLMGGTPKTALPSQDRNGAFSALRIKFATGRTSASLFAHPTSLTSNGGSRG
ncbi:hypothetical protein BJP34_04510 [Moorena producens PAL-8-15-08-1]|uniref:Uncharacterized protein n=1 Tax=Moorena producens PAL-8-15-08-1 TaxID=1458985 RepID=A0A1D8TML3_9CYAN|nr:hypothetical protein [Moorena producens]AOW98812.1 hypothetical protein BJP34_04510 [Moorena producens PAL-8-15-08-1]